MTTRDEAITAAGQVYAAALARLESMPPRAAAEAAWTPTGPSVDELEARIRRERGLPAAPGSVETERRAA